MDGHGVDEAGEDVHSENHKSISFLFELSAVGGHSQTYIYSTNPI